MRVNTITKNTGLMYVCGELHAGRSLGIVWGDVRGSWWILGNPLEGFGKRLGIGHDHLHGAHNRGLKFGTLLTYLDVVEGGWEV